MSKYLFGKFKTSSGTHPTGLFFGKSDEKASFFGMGVKTSQVNKVGMHNSTPMAFEDVGSKISQTTGAQHLIAESKHEELLKPSLSNFYNPVKNTADTVLGMYRQKHHLSFIDLRKGGSFETIKSATKISVADVLDIYESPEDQFLDILNMEKCEMPELVNNVKIKSLDRTTLLPKNSAETVIDLSKAGISKVDVLSSVVRSKDVTSSLNRALNGNGIIGIGHNRSLSAGSATRQGLNAKGELYYGHSSISASTKEWGVEALDKARTRNEISNFDDHV